MTDATGKDATGEDAPHHETAAEFVDEAELAAWETIEEIKDLPHEAKRLAEEGWDKLRHLGHHEHPEGSGQ